MTNSRYRKKKCDENRPRCGDCRRLNTPCRWPSDSPSQWSPSPSAERTSTALALSALAATSDTVDASDGYSWPAEVSPRCLNDEPTALPDLALEDDTSSLLLHWPPTTNPHLRTPDDRSLFNHYLHTVARILSRACDRNRNPFLDTLIPIAVGSDTVTSVILGLSGCHWKRVYPKIWNGALARQGKGMCYYFQDIPPLTPSSIRTS